MEAVCQAPQIGHKEFGYPNPVDRSSSGWRSLGSCSAPRFGWEDLLAYGLQPRGWRTHRPVWGSWWVSNDIRRWTYTAPGRRKLLPVKVVLVENDGVKHLHFGQKGTVRRQLATAWWAAKKWEALFFLPIRERLMGTFFISCNCLLFKKTVPEKAHWAIWRRWSKTRWILVHFHFLGFFRYKRIINQMPCLKLTWQACVMWSCNIIGCRLFFLVFVFTGQGALRRPVYILDKVHLEGFHLLTLVTSEKKLTVSKAWIRFTSIS